MKYLSFLFLFIFSIQMGWAQKNQTVKITGKASTEWNQRTENLDQAEKRAEDLACINALEKAFGRVMVQGNSTYIQNLNSNEKTESKTVYNMISNTFVKGEIVQLLDKKTIQQPYQVIVNGLKEGRVNIMCEVIVMAKEIKEAQTDFLSLTLSKPDKRYFTTSFHDGDNFYMYFKTPSSGYVSIYMEDGKSAFRILPYSKYSEADETGFAVQSDKDYILFYDKSGDIPSYLIDAYTLIAETPQDLYRVYVLFSKEPQGKPMLKETGTAGLSPEIVQKGYILPKSIQPIDFQKWLAQTLSATNKVQVQRIDLTVDKKE